MNENEIVYFAADMADRIERETGWGFNRGKAPDYHAKLVEYLVEAYKAGMAESARLSEQMRAAIKRLEALGASITQIAEAVFE